VKEREPGSWFKKDVNLVWAGGVKDDVTGLGTGTCLLSFCSKKAVTDKTKILFSVSEHNEEAVCCMHRRLLTACDCRVILNFQGK
jgi:hypothetical protein